MPTVHPRSDWVSPSEPVTGPAFPTWDQIDMGAILHYTAAVNLPDGDPGESTDIGQYLRNIHHYYLTDRGYSIGYNWAVDWRGQVWELRGWTFRNAANFGRKWQSEHGGSNVNWRTFSILCLVDGDDPVTDAAAASIRWLLTDAGNRAGRPHPVRPHSGVEKTDCCGDGIRAQINAGVFDLEEDPMYFGRVDGDSALYLFAGFTARWAPTAEDRDAWAAEFGIDLSRPRQTKTRDALRSYVLVGREPTYAPGETVRTSAADFGGWVA